MTELNIGTCAKLRYTSGDKNAGIIPEGFSEHLRSYFADFKWFLQFFIFHFSFFFISFYFAINQKYNNSIQKYIKDNIQYYN